jgi:hypothetical protein
MPMRSGSKCGPINPQLAHLGAQRMRIDLQEGGGSPGTLDSTVSGCERRFNV